MPETCLGDRFMRLATAIALLILAIAAAGSVQTTAARSETLLPIAASLP